MNKLSHYQTRYGQWAGNPKGFLPNYENCAANVQLKGRFTFAQCSRKCGYGKDGAFCKIHARRNPE